MKQPESRVWHPFMKDSYYAAWKKSYFFGVAKEVCRDIRRSIQRVFRGYCDYDLYSIFDWFLAIMPEMLREYKETRCGSPVMDEAYFREGKEQSDKNQKAWDAVLDRMIFLLREADEKTCSLKNAYEEAYAKAADAFYERYGTFGEKLNTEKKDKNRMRFPGDVPENREISRQYFEEEKRIAEYRVQCKDELFRLFSKWFFDLWD